MATGTRRAPALDAVRGSSGSAEHGARGGDEVNRIEKAGKNYGWPVISYGTHYSGGSEIGEGTAKPGMEQPHALLGPLDRAVGDDGLFRQALARVARRTSSWAR